VGAVIVKSAVVETMQPLATCSVMVLAGVLLMGGSLMWLFAVRDAVERQA